MEENKDIEKHLREEVFTKRTALAMVVGFFVNILCMIATINVLIANFNLNPYIAAALGFGITFYFRKEISYWVYRVFLPIHVADTLYMLISLKKTDIVVKKVDKNDSKPE